jgi:halocyanin-like protein
MGDIRTAVYSVGLYKLSTEIRTDMNRRTFLKTAGGAAGGAAAMSTGAAPASAASETTEGGGGGGGGEPDLGGYLDSANNFDGSVVDKTGQDEVVVKVGAGSSGLAFGPAAVHVDNGATIVWEWTGEGGAHNVVHEEEAFNSGSTKTSGTYEYTFEEDGIYKYFCVPHKASGMLGAVVVGTNYPTKATGGSTPLEPSHMGSSIREHYVGFAVILAISLSMVFTFFMLKYGESAHTSGGNN